MNEPLDPDALHDPRDAAAYWFARERSGRMDEAERRQFAAWRQARPEHDLEYRRAKGIWNAARLIPADRLRALAQDPAPSAGHRRFFPPRRLALGLGLACAAAVVTGVGWPYEGLDAPTYTAEFATQRGEHRQVALPDGSILDLDTATSLAVRFYTGRRVVVLHAGQAAFSVAADASQPFHVEAGDTSVRVTGTRFDVRKDGEQAQVTVESGTVEVKRGPWWDRSTIALRAGQGAAPRAQGGLARIDNPDIASIMAWKQGRIVFRNTPLRQAIAEINRYAATPIRLGDGNFSDIHVAGVFSTEDVSSFLELLPAIAPVAVGRLADGAWAVHRR
ncbi:FecR family protein [Castellaniella hirudinis]|uniref:FecR family protein n=1 Tax=Castellaniella hirudinis TaxID=1144617 RepID=UPI0039C1D4E7